MPRYSKRSGRWTSLRESWLSVPALVALTIAFSLASFQPAANATAAQKLTVRHIEQETGSTRVRIYLDARDGQGEAIMDLTTDQLGITLGREHLTILDVTAYSRNPVGTRIVFLADVSASMSDEQFEPIRDALSGWVGNLHERDRAALLVFGDRSEVVQDFTGNRSALVRAFDALAPRDKQTVLHQALLDALDLGRRRDHELPSYPVIVVLTDGRDEGSGLTVEDVIAAIEKRPAPIFSLGASHLRGGEKRQYLDVLRRLSAASGGLFFEVDPTTEAGGISPLDDAYRRIRRAIEDVWYVDVLAPEDLADGAERRLQVTLDRDGRILSEGREFRLLPGRATGPRVSVSTDQQGDEPSSATAAQPKTADSTGSSDGTGSTRGPKRGPAAAGEPDGDDSGVGFWPWLLAALAALLAIVWFSRKKRKDPSAATSEPLFSPLPQAAPVVARTVRFVVVRGSKRGKDYKLTLMARATVGAASDCDCVLTDESLPQSLVLTLKQDDGRLLLSHSGAADDVLVNGLRCGEESQLRNNDLIGTQNVIVRVEFND